MKTIAGTSISIEAELGCLGSLESGKSGEEDGHEAQCTLSKSQLLTCPEQAAMFIDLCPVGALTSKPYVFEARPWELKKTETIDVMDAVGSNIRVDTYGWEVKRVLPKINEDINEEWISDKTRYACDGIKNQRIDTPYLKNKKGFEKISWDQAYKIIVKKINETSSDKIAGFTGDLTNMETLYVTKEFFNKTIKSKYLDSRTKNTYVNTTDKKNYIFNSSINGIEDSDLIILIGTNPRYEATILNLRIRKSFLKNNLEVCSIGDVGDLTYPYKILPNETKTIKSIVEGQHNLSSVIENSKKPLIIVGESVLSLISGKYIFERQYFRIEPKRN